MSISLTVLTKISGNRGHVNNEYCANELSILYCIIYIDRLLLPTVIYELRLYTDDMKTRCHRIAAPLGKRSAFLRHFCRRNRLVRPSALQSPRVRSRQDRDTSRGNIFVGDAMADGVQCARRAFRIVFLFFPFFPPSPSLGWMGSSSLCGLVYDIIPVKACNAYCVHQDKHR